MDYGLVVTHLGCSSVNMLCRVCFRRQQARRCGRRVIAQIQEGVNPIHRMVMVRQVFKG
jgi:hypothetical protein